MLILSLTRPDSFYSPFNDTLLTTTTACNNGDNTSRHGNVPVEENPPSFCSINCRFDIVSQFVITMTTGYDSRHILAHYARIIITSYGMFARFCVARRLEISSCIMSETRFGLLGKLGYAISFFFGTLCDVEDRAINSSLMYSLTRQMSEHHF